MRDLQYITWGAILFAAGLAFQRLAGAFSRMVIGRTGPEQYGGFSLAFSIFMIVFMVIMLGLDTGISRFIVRSLSRKDKQGVRDATTTAAIIVVPVGLAAGIALWCCAPILENLFRMQIAWLLRWFALVLPFYVCGRLFVSVLEAHRKAGASAFVTAFSEGALRVGVLFVLFLLGYDILAGAIGYAVSFTAVFVMGIIALRICNLKFAINGTFRPEIIVFSVPLMLSASVMMIFDFTGTALLGYFRTGADVGLFNAAQPVARLLTLAGSVLWPLLVPVMTARHFRNHNLAVICQKVSKWVLLITLPAAAALIVFAKPILSVAFGPVYASAAFSLQLLAIAYLLMAQLVSVQSVLSARGNTLLAFLFSLLGFVANVIVGVWAVPRWGLVGASISTLAGAIVLSACMAFASVKIIRSMPFKMSDLKILFASIIASCIGLGTMLFLQQKTTMWASLLALILFCAAYIACILALKVLDLKDKTVMMHVFTLRRQSNRNKV